MTLVHGTWAHDAEWVESDSKLGQHLQQLGPNTILQSFRWTGNNSQHARLKAASRLSEKITDTAVKYPGAKQHIIAHSHGGNVALYALRDPEICNKVASVICLATPFIRAEARSLHPTMFTLRSLVYSVALAPVTLLVTALLILITMSLLFFPDQGAISIYLRDLGLPTPLVIIGIIILWGVLFLLGWRVSRKLNHWINTRLQTSVDHYQKKLLDRYRHYAAQAVPVLNIQVKGDEAGLWLRSLFWASEARGTAASVIPMSVMIALIFGIATTVSFINDGLLAEPFSSIVIAATIIIVITFFIFLVIFAISTVFSHLIFIVMPLLFRAHGGGFGEWSITANWLLKIEAYPEPAEDFQAETVRFTMSGSGLRHSQIYQDDRVIECIGEWLEKRE